MPNEPVQCPNCGSGHVEQLAADSYECEHCLTNFHWVNPTKRTVVHESRVCECGNKATAFCYRCHDPVCQNHKWTWVFGDESQRDLHRQFDEDFLELGLIDSGMYGDEEMDSDSVVFQAMKQHGLPDPNANVILCMKCAEECRSTLMGIVGASSKAAEQGRACTMCFSQNLLGQCSICKGGVCARDGKVCKICHQLFCFQHIASCKACNQFFCHEHISAEGWCYTCKPPALAKRTGCTGVLLALVLACAMVGLSLWMH